MPIYTYTVPEFVPFRMSLPIYNEQNEVVFLLKKGRHRLLTRIDQKLVRVKPQSKHLVLLLLLVQIE
ncbi:hypothetical protein G6549_21415 [Bacillus sp. MM2020_1]|nr:hypothetical protein [Bacillus sp. MM2020_1]